MFGCFKSFLHYFKMNSEQFYTILAALAILIFIILVPIILICFYTYLARFINWTARRSRTSSEQVLELIYRLCQRNIPENWTGYALPIPMRYYAMLEYVTKTHQDKQVGTDDQDGPDPEEPVGEIMAHVAIEVVEDVIPQKQDVPDTSDVPDLC